MLSSASILAADAMINFSAAQRKVSTSYTDNNSILPQTTAELARKSSLEKKVSFEGSTLQSSMENLQEVSESSGNNSSVTSPTALSPEPAEIPSASTSIEKISTVDS